MPALTKADLSEHLNDVVGLNKREAKEMVELLFEELSVSLIDGDPVRLSGFGNFELRDKNERPGRNPKTGERVPVSARRVVTFRAGQNYVRRLSSITHWITSEYRGSLR